MLKVCMCVDVENFISFRQGNPSWNRFERFKGRINNLIKNFRYNKNGFQLVYKTILRYKMPASFMLVGSLFKPISHEKFIDWGYHTLNHLPLTLISEPHVRREIKNLYNAVSFTATMWMIEDIREPSRVFSLLKREGYKITVYRGMNSGVKHMHSNQIKGIEVRYGIRCVHRSNGFEGNSPIKEINEILNEIKENSRRDAIYCLTTHDFTHRNAKNLELIIKGLKEMENKGIIKLVNLKNLLK